MRFMVFVKATEQSEAGIPPTAEEFAAMEKFGEALARDGVVLAGAGLYPSSKGVRINFAGGKPTVIDGPFTETKELVAGFSILQARSKEEIVERLKHMPLWRGEEIEIRQIFEPEDFGQFVEDGSK
jgi:hypothetical protein